MADTRCPNCLRELDGSECACGYPKKGHNASHQLPVGTILRGRYQIGKCLGQGGFGITYLAWDKLMQQRVAVKEFYPGGTVFRRSAASLAVECGTEEIIPHYEYSKERFLREAGALVKFRDIPEIVDILDFSEENNTAYIIMEYVRGVDLAKYIQMKGGKLTVEETFRILKPVMEALAKVHKGGIVHRDISPDNIILDPMGGAKLLDFGAVRAVEDPDVEKGLNKSTEAILKQGFAPIEQYNSRGSLGPWTDEYAMCATVFYCLTGRIPEEASIRMSEGIDPDWSAIPGLPEHQRKALEKGISCRAKDRYRSLDELLEALFPEETAQTVPEPAEEAPVDQIKEKAKVPFGSGKKFWTIFTTAVLALWLIIAMLIPKGIKTETEETIPQETVSDETAPAQIQTQPTEPIETEPPTVPLSPEEEAYLQAEALLEEGKLGEAAIAFGKLAGYSDARERSFEIWDMIADRETVSGGAYFAVSLKTNGTVLLAGGYDLPNAYTGWSDIVAVSAGTRHFVGLKDDGTVVSMHLNDNVVNGYGLDGVENWTDIVAIAAGSTHTVGLKADGTVVAVGERVDGMTSDPCNVEGWTDIVAISAGTYHTVGLKVDGTVVYAGKTNYGQDGVENWTDIIAISTSGDHTLGLKADGTVVAAGSNSEGQCYNTIGWENITAISAGALHSVGLKADGTVVAVGWYKKYGQCNVGDWKDIVFISTGSYLTLGLKADGTVIAVGRLHWQGAGDDLSGWTDIRVPQRPLPFR